MAPTDKHKREVKAAQMRRYGEQLKANEEKHLMAKEKDSQRKRAQYHQKQNELRTHSRKLNEARKMKAEKQRTYRQHRAERETK
jgi:hypothetical protein